MFGLEECATVEAKSDEIWTLGDWDTDRLASLR